MIESRNIKQYRCSECNRWFNASSKTIFLTQFHNGRMQNLAVFCSQKCKDSFHTKVFPSANNISEKLSC